jgi:hypothetical protein
VASLKRRREAEAAAAAALGWDDGDVVALAECLAMNPRASSEGVSRVMGSRSPGRSPHLREGRGVSD